MPKAWLFWAKHKQGSEQVHSSSPSQKWTRWCRGLSQALWIRIKCLTTEALTREWCSSLIHPRTISSKTCLSSWWNSWRMCSKTLDSTVEEIIRVIIITMVASKITAIRINTTATIRTTAITTKGGTLTTSTEASKCSTIRWRTRETRPT